MLQVQKDQRVQLHRQDLQVIKDRKGQSVPKDQRVQQLLRELKVQKDQKDLRVQ